MAEKLTWWKFPIDITRDIKILQLNSQYNGEGVKVYLFLLCYLHSTDNGYLKKEDIQFIANTHLLTLPEQAKEIIDFCIRVGLLCNDNENRIYSPMLQEQRLKFNQWRDTGKKGGQTSAENKASVYTFQCTDGKYTITKKTLEKWREKFKDTDVLLKEYQSLCLKDENQRSCKRRIKDHIEAYLITESKD